MSKKSLALFKNLVIVVLVPGFAVTALDDYLLRQSLAEIQAGIDARDYNAMVLRRGELTMTLRAANGQIAMHDIAITDANGTVNYGCRVVDGGIVIDPSAVLEYRPPFDRPRQRTRPRGRAPGLYSLF